MDPILELRGITKSFPGVKALAGIDLSVNPGEIHALLGENGAGKSTLMKVLSGIIPPDEGHIVIAGEEKRFGNYHDAVAAGVGIVFQEFSLIPYLNAVENIFLGRERRRFGLLQTAAMRSEAVRLFERLGVADEVRQIGMPKWGVDFVSPTHQRTVAFEFSTRYRQPALLGEFNEKRSSR